MDEGQTTRMFGSCCSNRATEVWQWTRRSAAHTVEFPPGERRSSDSNSRLQWCSGAQCQPADSMLPRDVL